MDWQELKEKLVPAGFIDNGDEIEKHFDGGYICFLKDGRVVYNQQVTFDEMQKIYEEATWLK